MVSKSDKDEKVIKPKSDKVYLTKDGLKNLKMNLSITKMLKDLKLLKNLKMQFNLLVN